MCASVEQVGLLDALVAAQPEARCDETFAPCARSYDGFTASNLRHSPRICGPPA